jgi:uncharacterized protein (DUF433 family)
MNVENHPQIELRPSAIHGQKACIVGTRISVQDIYVWHELMGKSPDQIVLEYPHLTLTQIHAALAFYFENAEQIRQQVQRGRDEAERIRQSNSSVLSAKLAELGGDAAPVSS